MKLNVKASEVKGFGRQAKLAVTTKEGFKDAVEVRSSDFAPSAHGFVWSNAQMDPTPPSERTWSWIHYFSVWFSYNFTAGAWSTASSLLTLNLTYWQAILACLVGAFVGGIATAVNSRQSSVYHIGFPTLQRVSFGLWGSLFPVFTRAVVAILWVGVTTYQSSLFLDVALRCIFGDLWWNIPNRIPASASVTTRQFVACFLVWILSYPVLALKIHKFRHLWTVKALLVPPVTMGMFIYCMVIGHSGATTVSTTQETLAGSELGWAFMFGVQAVIGSFSPLIASNPDIARYAKTPGATFWSQFATILFWKVCMCCIGIFGTNAVASAYGETYWNLWDLASAILDRNWTGGVRFAIFLFAVVMAFSEQVKNLSSNLISFGADTACLVPKYININRGMVLGLTVGFVIQPWYILATASSYLTFLTGYSLFLGAIPSIAVTDYLLRKGNVDVMSLFTPRRDYWYNFGVNWKAYVSYIFAIVFVTPGLAAQFNSGSGIAQGWNHIYAIGWLFAVATSAFVYTVLSFLFKSPAMFEARRHPFESYAKNQRALLDQEVIAGDLSVRQVASSTDEPGTDKKDRPADKGLDNPAPVITGV
ncbi:permease for cytosine/purines, uracil, thiamine, allantoin-domain-containing protein [Xylariaceae sp. FL0804]|nr:permease for cytosine/purines, uracil, thiamine, allantoin-domain-containing protein [Xylariaceae sp. FL0804]